MCHKIYFSSLRIIFIIIPYYCPRGSNLLKNFAFHHIIKQNLHSIAGSIRLRYIVKFECAGSTLQKYTSIVIAFAAIDTLCHALWTFSKNTHTPFTCDQMIWIREKERQKEQKKEKKRELKRDCLCARNKIILCREYRWHGNLIFQKQFHCIVVLHPQSCSMYLQTPSRSLQMFKQ